MLANYEDIKKRIKTEPIWYDSNGVPRYEKFHPDLCPNIYSHEVFLLLIACQDCGKRFLVEMNSQIFSDQRFNGKKDPMPHYGDPPRHSCVGDTMNCDDIEIRELWRQKNMTWKKICLKSKSPAPKEE